MYTVWEAWDEIIQEEKQGRVAKDYCYMEGKWHGSQCICQQQGVTEGRFYSCREHFGFGAKSASQSVREQGQGKKLPAIFLPALLHMAPS